MNKINNYTSDKYAPKKIYAKYGRINHLSNHCKLITNFPVLKPMSAHSMPMPMMPARPNMHVQSAFPSSQHANMPYMPNPYFNAFSMPQVSWNMHAMSNMHD